MNTRRRVNTRSVGDVALSAGLVAAVIPSIVPLFAGGGLLPLLVAVAAPAAVGLGMVVARASSGRWRLAGDAVAAVVILGLLPAGSDGRSALAGLPSGLVRLITAALPLPAAGPELAVVVLAGLVASAVTVELALRSTGRVSLLVPAAGLLVAAELAAAGGRPPPVWDAALVVGVAGVLVAWRTQRPMAAGRAEAPAGPGGPTVAGAASAPKAQPVGRALAGFATAAVIAVILVPVGPRLPGTHARPPYDLRAALSPAPRPVGQLNPLATYAQTYDGLERPAFTAQVTGTDDPTALFWRLTTLDGFDGFEWSPSAVYHRAGTQLPPGPGVGVDVQQVRAVVRLAASPVYLPAPERPTRVSIGGLDLSQPDAVLAVPVGLRMPPDYQVISAVPAPTAGQLLAAAIPSSGTNGGAPPVPSGLARLAATLIATAQPTPLARLQKLRDYLAGPQFSRQPPGRSPIGSGYYQVDQLLTRTHVGSAEQFAAAFAVLARSVGFRSRLAIGYYGGRPAGRTVSYTTRDLDVWPEVYLDGIGWYPFPVNPATGSHRPAAAPASTPLAQAFQQQQALQAAPPSGAHTAGPPGPPRQAGSGVPAGILAAAALVGLLLLAAAGVVGLKSWRWRRRCRGLDAAKRVAGTWEHVLDCLAEFGLRLAPSLTAAEVAERAGRHLGDAQAARVAWMVPRIDATRYDRRFPPTDAFADTVGKAGVRLVRAIRRDASWPARARARLSPAPLRRGRARTR